MIGFVYNEGTNPEMKQSILQYSAIYGVKAAAFSLRQLIANFHGEPLMAECWDGHGLSIREIEFPTIIDTQHCLFSERNLSRFEPGFSAWLMEKSAKLLRQSSVNKRNLPQLMLNSELSQYFIPTWEIRNYDELLEKIRLTRNAIMKPVAGRKGHGVCKLFRDEGKPILIQDKGDIRPLTPGFLEAYLKKINEDGLGAYALLQPCLDFSLDEEHAVDFRLLRHRGSTGEWEEVATYARIGATSLVSNVSQGGFYGDAKETLRTIAGEKADELYLEVMHIGENLPEIIQSVRGENAYCLGIDVAVDRNTLRPYVMEANTYPGTKFHFRQLAEKRVQYYQYLLQPD